MDAKFCCPICGYPELAAPPFDEWGSPSHERCPSCTYDFRFPEDPRARRADWIETGMTFRDGTPPEDFDPIAQLERAMHPLPRTYGLLGDSYRTKIYESSDRGAASRPKTSRAGA